MRSGWVDLREYAGLAPGLVLTLIVSVIAATRTARFLAISVALAWALLFSVGLILSVTITPSREALAEGLGGAGATFCDLSRIGPISLNELLRFREPSLNVLLYVPLGATVGLVTRSRRKAAVVILAVLMPFAIEATQGLLPVLGRVCESADVVDNLTGLLVGMGIGLVAGLVARGPGPGGSGPGSDETT